MNNRPDDEIRAAILMMYQDIAQWWAQRQLALVAHECGGENVCSSLIVIAEKESAVRMGHEMAANGA